MKKSRPTAKLKLGDNEPAIPVKAVLTTKNSKPTLQLFFSQNMPEAERWKNRALFGEWAFRHNQNVKKEEENIKKASLNELADTGRQKKTDIKTERREALKQFAIDNYGWNGETPVEITRRDAIFRAFSLEYTQHRKSKKVLTADAVAIGLYLTKRT